jgi:hypothetical protein
VPKPRAQVTEEARSIVISDHPGPGSFLKFQLILRSKNARSAPRRRW